MRYATLLALLCLVVAAQSAAVASAGEQHRGHCCALCHLGPIPILHTVATVTPTPVCSAVFLESAPEIQSIHEVALPTRSSRAPPASSLHA
jgi:hypothetical protein